MKGNVCKVPPPGAPKDSREGDKVLEKLLSLLLPGGDTDQEHYLTKKKVNSQEKEA